jgi:hypothetical protein
MSTFGDLSNSDLRAIANARAGRKFMSRKVSLYIILTGLMAIAAAIPLNAVYVMFIWTFVWAAGYIYVTSKVSDKIYRRLLELRQQEGTTEA